MQNDVKGKITLVDLIAQDGIRLRRIGQTYRGRCPWHNGKTDTSLTVDDAKGLYYCHGCGKTGDAIGWLRDYRGLSYMKALNELGQEPMMPRVLQNPEDKPRAALSSTWQGQAGVFLKQTQKRLWQHSTALDFLHGRGLNNDTIQADGLGWNDCDRYEDRDTWGLDPVTDEKGKVRRLWLPAGFVIPIVSNGAVVRLRIRRPAGEPRYYIVPGSDMRPMILGQGKQAVVIVESELDGLLLHQEARDMVATVALGTATGKPDSDTERLLKQAEAILIALDFDDAGARASWQYWVSAYPKARRWPVPVGKDPGEAFQKGLNIRAWIKVGLPVKPSSLQSERPTDSIIKPFPKEWLEKHDDSQLERLAIMTMDGGLADSEAERDLATNNGSAGVLQLESSSRK